MCQFIGIGAFQKKIPFRFVHHLLCQTDIEGADQDCNEDDDSDGCHAAQCERCGTMKAAAAVADQVIGDTYTDDQHADEEEPVYELTGFQIQNFYKEKIDQIADDEYLHIGQCCCEMDNVHGMKDDHTGGGSSLYDEKRPVTVL